jgi:hypothetical protein
MLPGTELLSAEDVSPGDTAEPLIAPRLEFAGNLYVPYRRIVPQTVGMWGSGLLESKDRLLKCGESATIGGRNR